MTKIPTLYHGTDARIVRMTPEERSRHIDDCKRIIDFLWPFYEPFAFTGEKHGELLSLLDHDEQADFQVTSVLRNIKGYKAGDSQWQYQKDCLYLTSFENNAEAFARNSFAGGEIGKFSFTLLRYLPKMKFAGFEPDAKTLESIKRISNFACSTPEPIVFEFNDLDPNDMVDDKEQKVQPHEDPLINQIIFRAVRYLKPIELDLDTARHIHKK